MICKEARKYLDTYVDGELEAGLMLEVENHLAGCADCDASILVKRRLKGALADLGQATAPAHLRAKVSGLAKRRQRSQRVLALGLPSVAAAAAVLVALFVPRGEQPEEPLAAVVDDVVERHVRELPMEVVASDPREASSWFRGKVDFPVRPPSLGFERASFQGARLSNVRAHQAAHMTYEVDGHRVSLMIFNPRSTSIHGGQRVRVGLREVLLGRRNGFNVAIFFDGDMAYALSSDLPRERLLELVARFDRRI